MEFIYDHVPNVLVVPNDNSSSFQIDSMQYIDETESEVVLRCAEYVELFKRGLVCDLVCTHRISTSDRKITGTKQYVVKDLVLVHIKKNWEIDNFPLFEYVFIK